MKTPEGCWKWAVAVAALSAAACGNADVAGGGGTHHPDSGGTSSSSGSSGVLLDGGSHHPDAGHTDGGHHTVDGGHVDAGQGCGLRTCLSARANCGPVSDGCNGIIDCGTCVAPQTCGGGGMPNVCGGTDGCIARTCADAGATCGPLSDGCGNLLDCGTCNSPETCGGGGVAYRCGLSTVTDGGHLEADAGCQPLTCAQAEATCGPVSNGCGGLIDGGCGTCTGNETCGGAGMPSQCGTPSVTCQPRTCSMANATCGYIGDGCGGSVQCGSCPASAPCGAGGVPNQCDGIDGGSTCTGLCLQQQVCSGNRTTTVSGAVVAPTNSAAGFGTPDPLPNALVYVPNGTVEPFGSTVTCDVCGAPASGDPLVSTTTFLDGGFVLTNVPVGTNIPLVIQLGRWRRQITIPTVAACQNNVLTLDQTRMPRNHTEGDIPHIAMVTGAVDSVECVLRKMGIDDSEFDGGGRVDIYSAPDSTFGGGYGAIAPNGTTTDMETLVSNPTLLDTYDLVIFACVGAEVDQSTTDQTNVIDYTNGGGRIYATHFGYVWLFNDSPFDMSANFDVGQEQDYNGPDTTTVDDPSLAGWLQIVGASTTYGQIDMYNVRTDFTSSVAPSETWLTDDTAGAPIHYTFNTPWGAASGAQCGRVVYSDFHVENATSASTPFPQECTVSSMTAQEKVLEYMLFDLSNCVTQTSPPPACTPLSCSAQGFQCGEQGDGCGNLIDGGCGACVAPQTCGGGGMPGICGAPVCNPDTCASLHYDCGPAADGCGNLIDGGCGACTPPQTCGGGGTPGQCGEGIQCDPVSCAAQHLACGEAGDGCGHTQSCGNCTPPQTCGGGGVPGQCGQPTCTPETCQGLGYQCGEGGDGCGGTVQCGVCDGGTCGGGGKANQCGTFELQ